jgi:hypothetical protein
MTVTAKSLAANTDAEDVFTNTMIRISFENPYLLQATLALSALHLGRLSSDPVEKQSYDDQAEKYHEAALNGFQSTVRDIGLTNYQAVLLFAGTLFPYACVASISGKYSPYNMTVILLTQHRYVLSRSYPGWCFTSTCHAKRLVRNASFQTL